MTDWKQEFEDFRANVKRLGLRQLQEKAREFSLPIVKDKTRQAIIIGDFLYKKAKGLPRNDIR
jgi:hypothetical protein